MVVFFLPSIRNLPTGGNIYNRRVIDYLVEFTDADIKVLQTDDPASFPVGGDLEPSGTSVAVIDSMLVRNGEGIRRLKERGTFSSFIMLVHYLNLLDPRRKNSPESRREEDILQVFDVFVTSSQFSKQALMLRGISHDKIVVVAPGLDSIYRRPIHGNHIGGMPHILTVSNLLSGKGLVEMVGILEELREIPWFWDLVGNPSLDPGYASGLQRRLFSSPISQRVQLHGCLSHEDVFDMYEGSRLFVLPSLFESSSMVVMEAMARGIPVVAFRVGGIPESVRGSDGARLVLPGDGRAFAAAIRELLTREETQVAMGREARLASRRFPSWDQSGRQFYRLLIEVQRRDGVGRIFSLCGM